MTYAIDAPADVRPGPLTLSLDGLAFDVRTPRGTLRLRSPLVGRPNAYNILAAAAAAMALDLPFSAIEKGIAELANVPGPLPGRLGRRPTTSASSSITRIPTMRCKNLLETARPLATGRVITVFGCGGDRDRTKRPLMGAVAARLERSRDHHVGQSADRKIRTRSSRKSSAASSCRPTGPRTGGARGPKSTPYLAISDRKAAIERAIREAAAGDLVLIAGKGHEKYQVIGERTLPFDDVEVARAALARRRAGSRVS